jgi:uncharacterized protein (DUF2267 family)
MIEDETDLFDRVAAHLPETLTGTSSVELTEVVLSTLAEHLTPEEAAELGAELPEVLGNVLLRASGEGRFDRDEFIEELASRLDTDDSTAEAGAVAVLGTLRDHLESRVDIDQVLATLPPELAQLMAS